MRHTAPIDRVSGCATFVVLLWMGASSCASGARSTARPEPAPGPRPLERDRDEIIALERQIQDWTLELGLPPRLGPGCGATAWDAKNLAEHICGNERDLCRIASSHPEVWTDGKCRSAQLTCRRARARTQPCMDGGTWPLIF